MSSAEPVFLDTSGLVGVLNAADRLHDQATRAFETVGRGDRPLITTDWVLAELGNSLARLPDRAAVPAFIHDLLAEPRARVVFVDEALLGRGLERYAGYTDKAWGLVDCVSFEVMSETSCRDAFTNDRHFEQAGFRRLLAAE